MPKATVILTMRKAVPQAMDNRKWDILSRLFHAYSRGGRDGMEREYQAMYPPKQEVEEDARV